MTAAQRKQELNHSFQVGDVVLVRKEFGDAPMAVAVNRVTKTQVLVTVAGRERRFDVRRGNEAWGYEEFQASRWSQLKLFPYTEQKEAKLIEEHKEHVKQQAKKRAAEDLRRAEERADAVRKMAEAKAACGGSLFGRVRCQDTMPDGSRMYVVDIPVHPNLEERKKGWERLMVRCVDVEELDWDSGRDDDGNLAKTQKVEAAYTYANGASHSFASVSTSKFDSDEDALWDAVRSQYHAW